MVGRHLVVAMLLSLVQVLTWLEANARRVIARVDSRDALIEDCARKYETTSAIAVVCSCHT